MVKYLSALTGAGRVYAPDGDNWREEVMMCEFCISLTGDAVSPVRGDKSFNQRVTEYSKFMILL